MATLYFIANSLNYLVVGTGNRSELTIGYFTKYGDGGVNMLPIGSLLKSEVRKLAKELGVPQPIIDKAPSAGLWMGQTDEEEMGFAYAELERYLTDGPDSVAPALALPVSTDDPLHRAQARRRRRRFRLRQAGERFSQHQPPCQGRAERARADEAAAGSRIAGEPAPRDADAFLQDGIAARFEPDQLVFEAPDLQRPDRVDRAGTQPRVLARQQRPERRLRRLHRRADDAVGDRDALVDGDLRVQERNQYLPQLGAQHIVQELERVCADDWVGCAETHVCVVEPAFRIEERHQPEHSLQLLFHRVPQRLQHWIGFLQLTAQRPENLVGTVVASDFGREQDLDRSGFDAHLRVDGAQLVQGCDHTVPERGVGIEQAAHEHLLGLGRADPDEDGRQLATNLDIGALVAEGGDLWNDSGAKPGERFGRFVGEVGTCEGRHQRGDELLTRDDSRRADCQTSHLFVLVHHEPDKQIDELRGNQRHQPRRFGTIAASVCAGRVDHRLEQRARRFQVL